MSYNQTPGNTDTKPKRKRSGCVTLLLAGTVVSICGFGIYACVKDDDVKDDEVEYVSNGRSYTNNHHIPGVGYFHAPFGAWFPHRYNDHDPSRGYYHGGQWNNSPNTSGVTNSVPNYSAVTDANRSWRTANPSAFAAQKSSMAASRSSSRGGFGSSFRSSSS
jgi:hypothetical protein